MSDTIKHIKVTTNTIKEVKELKKIDTDFITLSIIEVVRELFYNELEEVIKSRMKTNNQRYKTIYNDKYTYIELINEWLDEYQNNHLYNVINN